MTSRTQRLMMAMLPLGIVLAVVWIVSAIKASLTADLKIPPPLTRGPTVSQ